MVAAVSIILSCGKAGAESTHTHTELFEILTYLTQLNHKDSPLCMIAGLQLQNVVNGKSKSSVHSLLERREDLLRTLRISGEVWHPQLGGQC